MAGFRDSEDNPKDRSTWAMRYLGQFRQSRRGGGAA
jgi:hypothetical protein